MANISGTFQLEIHHNSQKEIGWQIYDWHNNPLQMLFILQAKAMKKKKKKKKSLFYGCDRPKFFVLADSFFFFFFFFFFFQKSCKIGLCFDQNLKILAENCWK